MHATSSAAALLCVVLALVACAHSKFSADFANGNARQLLLTCTTQDLASDTTVISVKIYNRTSSHVLAWVAANDGHPKFGNGTAALDRFLSGNLTSGDNKHSWLQLLLLDYDAGTRTDYFGCNISLLTKHQGEIHVIEWRTDTGEAAQKLRSAASTTSTKATTPASGAGASGEEVGSRGRDTDTQIRTGSVLQPTGRWTEPRQDGHPDTQTHVVETQIPLTVLITLLVLITVLVVVTITLLLQKFRGRCGGHELHHYPPPQLGHYSLAGGTLDTSWEEKMATKGSRPSLHCMPRSHYSLPPPPPPPPLPTLIRSRSRAYASNGRIPVGVRSHYMTPYDAIAQDSSEDGELSLLNTSRHDLTPSLPPEVAGEATYNVPRGDAHGQIMQPQVQAIPINVQSSLQPLGQTQGHMLYNMTAVKTPLALE